MHVFVWNSIQFVKSNNIEIRQIELKFKQKCVCIFGSRFCLDFNSTFSFLSIFINQTPFIQLVINYQPSKNIFLEKKLIIAIASTPRGSAPLLSKIRIASVRSEANSCLVRHEEAWYTRYSGSVELNSRQKRTPKIQTHFCLEFNSIWRISMLLDLTN